MYSVTVLADSMSPDEKRLTTLECIYPRFIHTEMLRHRMFSHSVASSRAIPTEKNIAQVRQNPFIPETFNTRVKGMGVGDPMEHEKAIDAKRAWVQAAGSAAAHADFLNQLGLDKSRANRLLEPFLWCVDIISATEWDNFFALRDHSAAQPEFQKLARMMREAMEQSEPKNVGYKEWHLPLVDERELATQVNPDTQQPYWGTFKKVSASRCARVSFEKHGEEEPLSNSIARAERLLESGHLSPFEHVARPIMAKDCIKWTGKLGLGNHLTQVGNFFGWVQMRKEIPGEHNFGLKHGEWPAGPITSTPVESGAITADPAP